MAAPSQPKFGGRRAGQRSFTLTLQDAARRGWACVTICGCLFLTSGCAWWREARDTLSHSQGLYKRALESELQGEPAEAVRLLRDSIVTNPNDPELRWELARVLLDQGDTTEALKELRYLVKHFPDDSRAYMSLARTLLERGRADDAARLADLAIDLDSRCTEALLLRGQISEVRGDVDLARETYHRILLELPENAEVRLRLGRIELEDGDPRIAAALLRETLADVPLTPEQASQTQWLLGQAYAKQERWGEAVAALSIGLPHHQQATAEQRYELAYACLQIGDHDRARQQLEMVLHKAPEHAPAKEMLAQLSSSPGINSRAGYSPVPGAIVPTTHQQR
ncbi:MAG: tetratricopeptide repeat protein [Planctomycetota bacterium]